MNYGSIKRCHFWFCCIQIVIDKLVEKKYFTACDKTNELVQFKIDIYAKAFNIYNVLK